MLFRSAKCMRSIMAIMSHRGAEEMLSSVSSVLKPVSPEFQSWGRREQRGGDRNKMLSTTRIIWKNNKATITHATHQLCVTVAAVEWKGSCWLCSASFPEKHFLYRVGKANIIYTINQASVITVSCTLLSPQKGYKQRILMWLHPDG